MPRSREFPFKIPRTASPHRSELDLEAEPGPDKYASPITDSPWAESLR